jgi:hypothetical protein
MSEEFYNNFHGMGKFTVRQTLVDKDKQKAETAAKLYFLSHNSI